jgi:menaquinol-cytochrome c reductase iron-sulfur subunit
MGNESPSCCCGCSKDASSRAETRRGFCGQAAAIVCGAAALATPVVAGIAAFLNPLRQKSQGGQLLRLASLDTLPEDGTPQRVPIIAERTDAWNRFPAEPIGAVFLRRVKGGVSALQVICPHAGCSIGFESSPQGGRFFCPCHAASFNLEGKRTDATSPSPRDMDSLEVQIRNKNEVWVKYESFCLGVAAKVAQS